MSRTLVGLCLLGTSLAAVAAPAPKDRPPLGIYHATKVGDTLIYEMDSGKGTIQVIEVVTDVERKDGEVIVTVDYSFNANPPTPLTRSVSPKGLYRLKSGARAFDPPVCLLKFPAKPGDTWETDQPMAKGPARTTCTFRGEEEVEVPAGKFKALKVEMKPEEGLGTPTTYWYVAGIGMVKSVRKVGDTERGYYVLKSFTPGK